MKARKSQVSVKYFIAIAVFIAAIGNPLHKVLAVNHPSDSVSIEFLPADDVIYKISGDLGFENWNLGFFVNGLSPDTQIDGLDIAHYGGQTRLHRIEYRDKAVLNFIKSHTDSKATFHNLHFSLPEALSIDSLIVKLLSNGANIGHKSINLKKYKQQNRYRLPILETWFVSSGHDFGVEHRRHLSRGHFAWDFIKVNERGEVASGAKLEENFSYGQPVVAPAAGIVVAIHDGEQDNRPGSFKGSTQPNFVEIDHGMGEFSRAVHLQYGSIQVSEGDTVAPGQTIGRVGNSGKSERPHLHFSFHRIKVDDQGTKQVPIPVRFSNYTVSWNQGIDIKIKIGRPRRGQFIRQN